MEGTPPLEIQMPEGFSLKEKVFFVCNYMQDSGEKITRDKVRIHTGGSDRDLSKYIGEWREQTAITVQGSEEIDTSPGTKKH
jgi:Plasmid replication region DNA-binding N-term